VRRRTKADLKDLNANIERIDGLRSRPRVKRLGASGIPAGQRRPRRLNDGTTPRECRV
jgi:hypothetical protein